MFNKTKPKNEGGILQVWRRTQLTQTFRKIAVGTKNSGRMNTLNLNFCKHFKIHINELVLCDCWQYARFTRRFIIMGSYWIDNLKVNFEMKNLGYINSPVGVEPRDGTSVTRVRHLEPLRPNCKEEFTALDANCDYQ